MKLNKKGKPYQDPLQWIKKCRVVNSKGLVYHPTKAPAGLCKCGVMLELKPRKEDYIFPSTSRAQHAISHTMKYLDSLNAELGDEFIVEKL